jgi:beta-glucanase (GH16 family)
MKKSIATSIILSTAIASTDYISGEIKTKKAYTYGKFITRMQEPDMYGTVSSFFTSWIGPNWYDGGWNEIDVEIVPSMAI